MTSRKKPTTDSGTGTSGRSASGRAKRSGPAPSPKKPATMTRRVVHDGRVFEPGGPVPDVDAATSKRWKELGWING